MAKIKTSPSHSNPASHVILALDKQELLVLGVTGIARHGKVSTVTPSPENIWKLMKIDPEDGPLSVFFQNYLSTIQQPERFNFFRVPITAANTIANNMQQTLDICGLIPHAIQKDLKIEQLYPNSPMLAANKKGKNSVAKPYKFNPDRIDWQLMEKMSMSKQALSELGILESLLMGYKTRELISVKLNLGIIETRLDAKLSLKQKPDGDVVVVIHGVRKDLALDRPFLGHHFTDEDKNNLQTSGNMGRAVNLQNPYTGESIRSIISIDPLTNELIAMRCAQINLPKEISGRILDQQQRDMLIEGKPLSLKNLTDIRGISFNAVIQVNACSRAVELLPNAEIINHKQAQEEKVNLKQEHFISKQQEDNRTKKSRKLKL